MNAPFAPQTLPLDGVRVVEASAGTGKTFTIATLYLRLILERGLLPEQIVVATFTRAAAAELSMRLRERLSRAANLLAGDEPQYARDGDDNATRALRATFAAALQRVDLAALRKHAREAGHALDAAMIGTLHGFCHRVLNEFGFELGRTLSAPELLEDARAFETEIVADFWRRGSADTTTSRLLAETWGSPDALAKQVLDPRWRGRARHLADADAATDAAQAARLLLAAREHFEHAWPERLRAQNLMSHDQAVDTLAMALRDSARRDTAIARIGARYKAALIDEFQDTDAAQWDIVHALFGASTLVLVGDPKQAIYAFRGGDVHAWLEACARRNGEPLRLTESHRAGAGMCGAINALFSAPGAFLEHGIEHADAVSAEPVRQRALLRNGKPMRALQVWQLPEYTGGQGKPGARPKGAAETLIESACVAQIAALLDDARRGTVQLRNGDGSVHRLQPKHIAVLVNKNAQADSLQAALTRVGVPASSNLQASVYASAEAGEALALLEALRDPADARRARAAQATVLIGGDSARVAASDDDDSALQDLLDTTAQAAREAARHGPLPWLHRLIADAAPRLLALPDGDRRVANYLQLAELLQERSAAGFGLDDLAVHLARARDEIGHDADSARLRLDTDADAVTVSTVHAAKGLEYEVVLLPYAVLGRKPERTSNQPALTWYHDGNAPRVAIGANADAVIAQHAQEEIRAEEIRKFYVGVTRACALCVLPWGWVHQGEFTAAHALLHVAGHDAPIPCDAQGCARALLELRERVHDAVEVVPMPDAQTGGRSARDGEPEQRALAARGFNRALERDWRVWSFTTLSRGAAHATAPEAAPGAADEDASAGFNDAAPMERTLAGPRFGSAVHAVLERADFAAWRDAGAIPETQRNLIERALRAQNLPEPGPVSAQRAAAIVGECVRGALNVALPCGARLCELPDAQRRAELPFHLRLAPTRSARLFALLHEHGYQRSRNGFGAERLNGLLTGVIDLVFEHGGRYHLIDYKTNLLPAYDAAALQGAIDAHDYDLQYLLYTLALHRWLRQALRDYDYDARLGDVYYLFVRDLSAGRGVHRDRPPRELIEAMDALFDARGEFAA